MNILLLGILGSGKTSVGKLLAEELGYSFIELDAEALRKTSFKTVGEVYKDGKLSLWREKEMEAAKELSQNDNQVIACGGAVVENTAAILYFKESSISHKIIYLKTSPDTLTERLTGLYKEFKKEGARKVLQKMKKFHTRRNELYSHYANWTIETDDCTSEESAEDILTYLDDRKTS